MNLGISMFEPHHADLAKRMVATWAHWTVDLSADVPADAERHAAAADCGLRVVTDCRTTLGALRRVATTEEGVAEYAARILRYCDAHPVVTDVELWGCAEVAYIAGTKGPATDYARILNAVAPVIRAARPDIRLWTGGFGSDFDPMFADACLAKRVPAENYDVVNWHPLISLSPPRLENYREVGSIRLGLARRHLKHDKPFTASIFGIPTVPIQRAPDPNYGDYWRVGGARALLEVEALGWYTAMLTFLGEEGFEVVCIKAQDHLRPGQTVVREWQQVSGLLRRDGTEKAFVRPLLEWLSEYGKEPLNRNATNTTRLHTD